MKFIVPRRTWFRGQGTAESRLLTLKGMRCCVGSVGQQCGVSDAEMKNRKAIHSFSFSETDRLGRPQILGGFLEWMYLGCGFFISSVYNINDNPNLSDAEREKQLKEKFAEQGDEIEFIN
jgi:hypothetical protein